MRDLEKFRNGLWRIEPPWWLAMWSFRFWQRQRVRLKVWWYTGKTFL